MSKKQQIILTTKGRGTEVGDKVLVDEDRAAELVELRLAEYPPNSKAAAEQSS